MRGGGALTASVFNIDVDLTSAGYVVSVGLSVLLWAWVTGPSGVDAITMLIGRIGGYQSIFDIHPS